MMADYSVSNNSLPKAAMEVFNLQDRGTRKENPALRQPKHVLVNHGFIRQPFKLPFFSI